MMDRRNFTKKSGILFLGGFIVPVLNVNPSKNNLLYVTVLRSLIPVARKLIKSILIKGFEEYASHKLVHWIDENLGIGKSKDKELQKIPVELQDSNTIINANNVYVYTCSSKQASQISIIPLVTNKNINTPIQLLNQTYIPIFEKSNYLDTFNFVELVAINQLVQFYLQNENLGKKAATMLRRVVLPISHNSRAPFFLQLGENYLGSITFKTKAGAIHILYEVSKELKVKGNISFYAKYRYDKIPSTNVEFQHDFKKQNN